MADLEATRELCVQLDRSKASLTTQLSTQSLHYEQLQGQLSDMQAERDLLNTQLRSEQSTLEQLQGLLSSERAKEYHSQLVGKEREEEVRHLRELLAKLEADRCERRGGVRGGCDVTCVHAPPPPAGWHWRTIPGNSEPTRRFRVRHYRGSKLNWHQRSFRSESPLSHLRLVHCSAVDTIGLT